jgi:hypothetical protein
MKAHRFLGLVLVSAFGCGHDGPKTVPVSGVVTLNGKPLAGATVTFSPIAKPGEVNAGDGSSGKTNDNGEYTLTTSRGVPGAQVGKHRVGVSALSQQAGSSDERPPRGGWPLKDKVPARYSGDSALTFEVTAGGPNKADFALTSP